MRLLLVEDDQRTADFIISGLKQAGYQIDHVSDGHKAYFQACEEVYDAAVMDVMLPGMDGLTIIQKLRAREISLPIIVLSARKEVDERIKGLEAGADDYLVKPFAFSELLARLQTITRRTQGEGASRYLRAADLSLDTINRRVTRQDKRIELQPREYSLLEYLLRNKGRIVSKIMIMENVWEYNFDPQTNVVESRICHLRDKVDKGFDQKLIQTIRGMGYVIED
jgi:two-component system, OmpR family, response regulator